MAQSHRHILSSPWISSSILTQQTEKLRQVRSLGTLKERQWIKPARFLGCNGNVRRAFQASIR